MSLVLKRKQDWKQFQNFQEGKCRKYLQIFKFYVRDMEKIIEMKLVEISF